MGKTKKCENCKHAKIDWFGFWFGSGPFFYEFECNAKNIFDMKSYDEIYEETNCDKWQDCEKDKHAIM